MADSPLRTDESSTGVDHGGTPPDERVITRSEEFDPVVGIVAEEVVGVGSGPVGTVSTTVVSIVAESVGVSLREPLARLAKTVGVGAVLLAVAARCLVFPVGGRGPWPLPGTSPNVYLPSSHDPSKRDLLRYDHPGLGRTHLPCGLRRTRAPWLRRLHPRSRPVYGSGTRYGIRVPRDSSETPVRP
jgi:hypothetical protein